jgi:hypothetical protein
MECLCVAWCSLCGVRVWAAEWKKKNEPEDLSKNMNEKITCEHGNLCPSGGRRVVPAQVMRRHHVIRLARSHKPPYETLASAYPSLKPLLLLYTGVVVASLRVSGGSRVPLLGERV